MVDDEASNALFEILLTWLNPNREEAWKKYRTIHEALIKIFTWRGCRNAEDLAHEVINRVEQKMPDLITTYNGDPARYFYGVAQNVVHEYRREERRFSEFKEDNASTARAPLISDDEQYESGERQQCLRYCLDQLSERDREIVLEYYQYDQKTKLADRKRLANELGLTMNAMWIRVSRIRSFLAACIRERLNNKSEVE
jgi:RNA polymerase sigma factor (sigma-70 family)